MQETRASPSSEASRLMAPEHLLLKKIAFLRTGAIANSAHPTPSTAVPNNTALHSVISTNTREIRATSDLRGQLLEANLESRVPILL